MANFVVLPKLGMNQEDSTILEWLVPEGSAVRSGQPIVVIETDKASVEVESPADGVLARIVRPAGAIVPINGVVGVVLAPGEQMPGEIPDKVV